jgi:hypothetical protein
MINVYEELAVDLLMAGNFTIDQTRQIVTWLQNENLIDYDTLKEYYLTDYEDEDEED